MIADSLKNWRLYGRLAELKPAFEFLEKGLASVDAEAGRVDIDGDRLFVLPQSYQPKPIEQGRLEAHRRYADIQYVADGTELMGYTAADGLEVAEPYDAAKDIVFYKTPPAFSSIIVPAGSFAVFYPADAHMPGIRLSGHEASVRKLVVKALLP